MRNLVHLTLGLLLLAGCRHSSDPSPEPLDEDLDTLDTEVDTGADTGAGTPIPTGSAKLASDGYYEISSVGGFPLYEVREPEDDEFFYAQYVGFQFRFAMHDGEPSDWLEQDHAHEPSLVVFLYNDLHLEDAEDPEQCILAFQGSWSVEEPTEDRWWALRMRPQTQVESGCTLDPDRFGDDFLNEVAFRWVLELEPLSDFLNAQLQADEPDLWTSQSGSFFGAHVEYAGMDLGGGVTGGQAFLGFAAQLDDTWNTTGAYLPAE